METTLVLLSDTPTSKYYTYAIGRAAEVPCPENQKILKRNGWSLEWKE